MATVVRHKKTGKPYLLIGAGFGAYHASKPNWLFGDWVADETKGALAMCAVADEQGEIGWFISQDLQVVEIDGVALSAWRPKTT